MSGTKKKVSKRYAVCINNVGSEASLERNKIHVVLQDLRAEADGLVRVIDEDGDEGFTVTQANSELGLLTATKDSDVDRMSERVAGWVLPFYGGNRSKTTILEVTCNVTSFGSSTKVRANFHERILNQKGLIKTIKGIDDPVFHQNFFSLVDKAIFLQKENVGSVDQSAEWNRRANPREPRPGARQPHRPALSPRLTTEGAGV